LKGSLIRTADVSDALDRVKAGRALGGFFAVIEGSAIAGNAMPVQVSEKSGPKDMRAGLRKAIEIAPSGSVLVISSTSDRYSAWGGLVSLAAKSRIEGAVVSGCIRDLDEISALGFPVFAKAKSPVSGYGRLEVVSVGEPVVIDGVVVRAGDLVVADADGVAFVPRESVKEVKRIVAEAMKAETKIRTASQRAQRSSR
jgi:regulator of RNase E activity RraA